MTARTKLRLRSLPVFLGGLGYLAFQGFAPQHSTMVLFVDFLFVLFFAGYSFWWFKVGNTTTGQLINQMKAEEATMGRGRMYQVFRTSQKIWPYAGLFLLLALTNGKGTIWFCVGTAIYAVVYLALILLTPVSSTEETNRQTAEWLAQIDRDYKNVRSVEDRLDELERLKRRDMVTPEEYASKRQEILSDL